MHPYCGIEMFYATAIARGYAGSQGIGEVVSMRTIGPGMALREAGGAGDFHVFAPQS